MARLTVAQQIEKAAAEGNLELVKELAGKLVPKTKAKAKPRKSKPKASEPAEPPDFAHSEDFQVAARKPTNGTDNNGVQRSKGEPVPFEKKKRPNEWQDDPESNLDDVKIDKKLNPKQRRSVEKRPPASKIQVKCFVCKKMIETWPQPFGDNFTCDYCLGAK